MGYKRPSHVKELLTGFDIVPFLIYTLFSIFSFADMVIVAFMGY